MEVDLSRFCCQHPDSPDSGKRGHGNLTVCSHYGKAQQHRLLYCRTCKSRFSEWKGTPQFRSGLPEEKAIELIEHLADRDGVRATARLVGVNRNTVVRHNQLLGDHAHAVSLDPSLVAAPLDCGAPYRPTALSRPVTP
jgi:hypothetical protein